MEFLMTYGWAILVVLAAIGALAYFGILSPDRILPQSCTMSGGFNIVDCKATAGTALQMSFQNNLGADATNVTFTFDLTPGSAIPACVNNVHPAAPPYINLANGETTGTPFNFCDTEMATATTGRIKGTVEARYTKSGETLAHTATGSVNLRLE
ncbi:MAG: hypothetical protein HC945_04605 [Nitrosarchaeum sp.]|nr:hypothetical protein [Nitrosarchaeum sp.]